MDVQHLENGNYLVSCSECGFEAEIEAGVKAECECGRAVELSPDSDEV